MTASCYLLEFSVLPGGSRQGDVFAAADLPRLRALLEGRHDPEELAYHTIWYGCVLHLWVVEDGVIVAGFDLHEYLTTGDARLDAAMRRTLDAEHGSELRDCLDYLIEMDDVEVMSAVPGLARVCELIDSGAEDPVEDFLLECEDDGPPRQPCEVRLDWAAIPVPPLAGPPPRPGEELPVTWADGVDQEPESVLVRDAVVRLGLNDFENLRHEYD